MKEELRYEKQQQKSKKIKLDKKDKMVKKDKMAKSAKSDKIKNIEIELKKKEKETLTKGRRTRYNKEERVIGERELKVLKLKEKKDKLINKVNDQKGEVILREKLNRIFAERKSKKKK